MSLENRENLEARRDMLAQELKNIKEDTGLEGNENSESLLGQIAEIDAKLDQTPD